MAKITAFSFLKISKGHLNDVVESIKRYLNCINYTVLTGDYDALIEIEVELPSRII